MTRLFSKEKDIVLKIVNSVLVLVLIFSIVIAFGTGIKIVNNSEMPSYEVYSKETCALDQLPYECSDDSCKKEVDEERYKECNKHYVEDKKENESLHKSNVDNFLISISTTIIISLFLYILNKKTTK